MPIKILRFIDKYLFGFLILILFWLKYFFVGKKDKFKTNPKRILVIRLWALGSSLLTFPMIKQLKDHYGDDVQYDLLASDRNIGIFKNQGYFNHMYNLFKFKDIIGLICKFKYYDIVIDTEEYFKISSFLSLWTGKLTISYSNLWIRKLAYTNPKYYIPNEHNLINCISLLQPLGIQTYKPDTMEPLVYHENDKIKVNEFLNSLQLSYSGSKLICVHTGGAETSPDRFRASSKWIELIRKINEKYGNKVIILLSGTKFEENGVKEIIKSIGNISNVINICGKINLFEFDYQCINWLQL